MENPEEILHHLEEFSKLKPKSIPRELEDYLSFVAKTGDPVYQWSVIKYLFREKLISVITDFYESCPSVDIPPCPNVDLFNYDTMKTFILEKLDTFIAAPFTVQRICELLTTPRKEYNRIDKYMRALEKNILVVSTTEPGHQRTPENGDGFVNGIESDHMQDGSHEINIEEMDDGPMWPRKHDDSYQSTSKEQDQTIVESLYSNRSSEADVIDPELESEPSASSSSEAALVDSVITCCPGDEQKLTKSEDPAEATSQPLPGETTVETASLPAVVQRRRNSIEPVNDQLDDLSSLADDNTTTTIKPEIEDITTEPSISIKSESGDKLEEASNLSIPNDDENATSEEKVHSLIDSCVDASLSANVHEDTAKPSFEFEKPDGDPTTSGKREAEDEEEVEHSQAIEQANEIEVAELRNDGVSDEEVKTEEVEESSSSEVTGIIESEDTSTSPSLPLPEIATLSKAESNLSESGDSNDSSLLQSKDEPMDVDEPIMDANPNEGHPKEIGSWPLAEENTKAELESEPAAVLPDQQPSESKADVHIAGEMNSSAEEGN